MKNAKQKINLFTMIKLDNITFFHRLKNPQARQEQTNAMHFNAHISKGEKVAIIGASGAGKSTLLSLIAGFSTPTRGEIWLNGKNHTRTQPHQRPVSILFQDNNLFNHLSVEKNIALGIAPHLKLNKAQQQSVIEIAEQVGLAELLKRLPEDLSGGQRQRVALARCMLRERPILLLDEPFSALDQALRADMLSLLRLLCQEKNLTLLMVTHQPEELDGFVNRVMTVHQGVLQ